MVKIKRKSLYILRAVFLVLVLLSVASIAYAGKYIRYQSGRFEIIGADNLTVSNQIGLGTTSPGYKLDIKNSDGSDGTTLIRLNQNNASKFFTGLRIDRQTSEKWFLGIDNVDEKLRIYRNGTIGNKDLTIDTAGNVGVGSDTPGYKLDVQSGQINASGGLCIAGDCKTSWGSVGGGGTIGGSGTANYIPKFSDSTTLANSAIYDDGANIGLGTASPTSLLHTVASGAKTANYAGNSLTNIATSSTASITKTGLSVESTGTWDGSSAINRGLYVNATGGTNNYPAIFQGGFVGIGRTDPGYGLDLKYSGATGTAMVRLSQDNATRLFTGLRLDRASDAEKWFIGMNATDDKLIIRRAGATNDLTIGTDGSVTVDKLTATTIDPVYDIGGKKYATYVADVAGGVKTETTGKIEVKNSDENGNYLAVFNLDRQPEGSDLWLFEQTADFGENMKNLAVLLTPENQEKVDVWYELKPDPPAGGNQLIIHAEKPTFVSYHLVAPRIDHEKWSNFIENQSAEGMDVSQYGK